MALITLSETVFLSEIGYCGTDGLLATVENLEANQHRLLRAEETKYVSARGCAKKGAMSL